MKIKGIEIKIDRLINSIRNVFTGDVFDTEISTISKKQLKSLKPKWNFDWIREFEHSEVYKLT